MVVGTWENSHTMLQKRPASGGRAALRSVSSAVPVSQHSVGQLVHRAHTVPTHWLCALFFKSILICNHHHQQIQF